MPTQPAPGSPEWYAQGGAGYNRRPGNWLQNSTDFGQTSGQPGMSPQSGVTVSNMDGHRGGTVNQPGTFSQSNNLIGSQINPTASGRLTGFRSLADNAAQNYAGQTSQQNIGSLRTGMQTGLTSMGAATPFTYKPLNAGGGGSFFGGGAGGASAPKRSTETEALRGKMMTDLEGVRGGAPDRTALAGQSYDQLVQRSQPQFEQQVRGLGQKTAALGRVGSGLYNSELSDLATSRERDLDLSRRELATQSAGLQLQDRGDILNATRGVSGDIFGQDMDEADLAQRFAAQQASAASGAARSAQDERDFEFDVQRYNNDLAFRRGGFEQDSAQGVFGAEGQYDDRQFGRSRSQFGDLADYSSGIEDSERRDRGEIRGERDYQYGLDRDARGDAMDDRMMQEDLLDRRFRRGTTAAELGYGGSPYGAYQDAAGMQERAGQRQSDRAADAYGAAGDIAGSWASRRQRERQAPRRPTVPTSYGEGDEVYGGYGY